MVKYFHRYKKYLNVMKDTQKYSFSIKLEIMEFFNN